MVCPTCAEQVKGKQPMHSAKSYSRAVLLGVAAAVAGCTGYALFSIVSGITLGWAAIGVGDLAGWAMKKGSRGLGGRRYQVTAALLTYAAVAVAFVPIALHARSVKQEGKHVQTATQRSEGNEAQTAENKAAADTGKTKPKSEMSFPLAVAMLLGIGLISPFLILISSVGSGVLNFFIIFLGIRMAWRLTDGSGVQIDGPFQQTARLPGF